MNLLILVVDDERGVEVLFRRHFRRDFRVRWRHSALVRS
jgi:hypothetical protein